VADLQRSRPLRLAVQVGCLQEDTLAEVFSQRVAVRLQGEQAGNPDARESFLFAVNQILRFCPNVSISLPPGEHRLAREARRLATAIVAPEAQMSLIADDRSAAVTLTVGTAIAGGALGVAVSSSGWLARMLTSGCEPTALPTPTGPPNPIGALAAACLGAGQVFTALAGMPLLVQPTELSLFDRSSGAPGQLTDGPVLPSQALTLDALLVGCGAVMHGFAYTIVRLPVTGRARAVDRQRLRRENLGPYVLSDFDLLGLEKTEVLRRALAPRIEVAPYAEDFDPLFTVRLDRGHFPLPPIVVAGLDNVVTRHTVQRLWPAVLIDMGAGGTTAQATLKRRAEPGMCVLEALHIPPGELADVQRLVRETGLAADSVLGMDSPISEQDVLDAPVELRDALATARREGQLRCGFIRTRALDHEQQSEEFAAAAPFVVAYSGVIAAAELMKELMGVNQPGPMRHQFSFASCRGRTVSPPARERCECAAISCEHSNHQTGGSVPVYSR